VNKVTANHTEQLKKKTSDISYRELVTHIKKVTIYQCRDCNSCSTAFPFIYQMNFSSSHTSPSFLERHDARNEKHSTRTYGIIVLPFIAETGPTLQ
jgi:hypothetical protein